MFCLWLGKAHVSRVARDRSSHIFAVRLADWGPGTVGAGLVASISCVSLDGLFQVCLCRVAVFVSCAGWCSRAFERLEGF